ncbi:MAG: hypothetical protein ACRDYA_24215 [Egibacteraceae bacterium]
MNAEEALNRVRELVDATLTEVAPNAKLTPDSVAGGVPCENSLTGHTGQNVYDYGFSFPAPDEATGERLVREAARFWNKRGHKVRGVPDDPSSPVIFTGEDGFNYQFIFARRTLSVSVGGSTPCVDPLPGDV